MIEDTAEHAVAVAERWQEIESGGAVRRKVDAMNTRVLAIKMRHTKRVNAMLNSPRSMPAKIEAIWQAVDELAEVIRPHAACKRGCSHCCYQSVLISAPEAELIGKRIGVKPRKFEGVRERDDIEAGYHNPCPFLKDDACSIYAHRPLPCRKQFNLDRDALLCELIGPTGTVPYADLRDYDMAALMAASERERILEQDPMRPGVMRPGTSTTLPYVGDIRDFFPRGKH